MSQEIKNLKVEDLVLWTENPRDPISPEAQDQDVVNRALQSTDGTWDLHKLAKSMGENYDFSELPTVVIEDDKPVVYDGNRRIILAKIYHKLVDTDVKFDSLPKVPLEIPCNVCSKDMALKNVLRKHGESGSWKPLERDMFIAKYGLGEKSDFLIIDECTGVISENKILNQGFVKKEIFNTAALTQLGFKIDSGRLLSRHTKDELRQIFDDIIDKVENKSITTRSSRGKIYEVLDTATSDLIENNKDHDFHAAPMLYELSKDEGEASSSKKDTPVPVRKTKRVIEPGIPFFGKDLILQKGNVNNLYRDILDLHRFYKSQKLSKSFCVILRMSLRLLCETAATSRKSGDIKFYIKKYFEDGKKLLDKDAKTLLAAQSVTQESLPQLLHTGAHNYSSSGNYDQTLAISVILGGMLSVSHGKK